MERKLAAILSADVAGYSRLIEDDDEATIETLTEYRSVMQSEIVSNHGRVVDTAGDSLLAEFASVIDAISCALAMQRALKVLNDNKPVDRQMRFRMGVNVGDVIFEGDRLYGDGVNIAARLENLAEPGGICISGSAHEQVDGKLAVDCSFMGEQVVKNISKPVSVWRLHMEPNSVPPGMLSHYRKLILFAVLLLVIITTTFRWLVTKENAAGPETVQTTGESVLDGYQMPSDRGPSPPQAMIVLPFTNMSESPDSAYFSDGITEDITTDLAKLDSIYVVPANTARRYRGDAIDTFDLVDELGVRYMLEGSTRKAGDKLRITARLTDIKNDKNLWSERYDRELTDVFALQDEIRRKILTALRVNLTPDEKARFRGAPTRNLEAYDFYLRGRDLSLRARREARPDLMGEAEAMFLKAVDLDPEYATAYASLGLHYWLGAVYGWQGSPETLMQKALALYQKAWALDDSLEQVLRYSAQIYMTQGDFDGALDAAHSYLERWPHRAESHYLAGWMHLFSGNLTVAVTHLDRARDLFPRIPVFKNHLFALSYYLAGREQEALTMLEDATRRAPNFLGNQVMLTILYEESGRIDAARRQAERILEINPEYSTANTRVYIRFKDDAMNRRLFQSLVRAGIPAG